MTLLEKISAELKASMMAKDADRTGTLRMLKSAIGYAQIEKKVDALGDADVLVVVQKEAKKRRDASEEFEKGGRPELAAKERAELKVLEELLPKQLTPEETEALVKAAIAEAGATSKKDMGAVMKLAQAKAAGRIDGRSLSTLVNRLLP
ncbi:MAG TPA: GatB/YqeY domain-containing protein [Candidatus Limnocylindria bacterium]|jgi:uncharacterized protein YqeY|nr:GatB/YqeY domain-containing protein [Candidatus Limnocylindria bacterium]